MNAPRLTPREWRAVRTALAFVLAGEPDSAWPDWVVAAMQRALAKLLKEELS